MNIDEILLLKYPDEIAQGKIQFIEENNGEGVVISFWDMPIPQPSKDEILGYQAELSSKKEIHGAREVALYLIKDLLGKTANERSYDSPESCASYALSTVPQWKLEAETFIAWRDAVYQTAINAYDAIEESSQIPEPSSFMDSLPKIVWPN
jgi:hypothetical protein